jgi:hypothetical protein
MKLRSAIVVAVAAVLWANVSHACATGSEAKILVGHQVLLSMAVAQSKPQPMNVPQAESEVTPAWQVVLLDHEGDNTDAFGPGEWAAAIAELKTEWDVTWMLNTPIPPSQYDEPQCRFLVEDEDEPLASLTSGAERSR